MKISIKINLTCLLLLWAGMAIAQTFNTPKLEKLTTIGRTWGAGAQQDWAVYGDSLYRFYDKFAFIDVIDVSNLKRIKKQNSIYCADRQVEIHVGCFKTDLDIYGKLLDDRRVLLNRSQQPA